MTDRDVLKYLESDQLAADTMQPLPPAKLSRRASTRLWALRVLVVALSAMVVYTFITQLAN